MKNKLKAILIIGYQMAFILKNIKNNYQNKAYNTTSIIIIV
ncbi:Hypothetical protein Ccan_20760 [Capnocytophaga canimorsus Cc5]|uniref:Uncharacterized protein n=1 Tax=Capnocytophaga canimorsus (strain 5) TaxID=860228 RepID=F9YU74_CAPCC|nr:Hypothetical protein Ccan_20760 [Capnocytophaga canimorsus Cc5]